MGVASLVPRLAALSLTVDEITVERLRRRLADGSVRCTSVVRLRGRDQEGVGEEVTFQPDDLLSAAPSCNPPQASAVNKPCATADLPFGSLPIRSDDD